MAGEARGIIKAGYKGQYDAIGIVTVQNAPYAWTTGMPVFLELEVNCNGKFYLAFYDLPKWNFLGDRVYRKDHFLGGMWLESDDIREVFIESTRKVRQASEDWFIRHASLKMTTDLFRAINEADYDLLLALGTHEFTIDWNDAVMER